MSTSTAEIAHLWRHANRLIHDLFRNMVDNSDLPPTAYLIVRRIQQSPGTTVSELGRRLGLSKSHISNVTELLVQEGYIERRTDPADQRLLKLHLTPWALERLGSIGDRAEAIWAVVFNEFPAGELDELAGFLKTLTAALERANARIDEQHEQGTLSGRGV